MKKLFRGILIVFVLLIAVFSAGFYIYYLPIMVGMDAKFMCSCVFVAGRTPESVRQRELSVFPGLTAADITINAADTSVTARLLGHTGRAIYRKGLGCTLLAKKSEAEIRSQRISFATSPGVDQDTIAWPQGNKISSTRIAGVDYEKIRAAVDAAFQDRDPDKPIFTHGVVVIYNGDIIGEKYAEGFDYNSRQMGWSMTKSMVNAMIGMLVADGLVRVTDPAPVEVWQNDDRRKITITHLLQATPGLRWNEGYFSPFSDFHQMFTLSDDKPKYAASLPLQHEPGTHFQYSSGCTNILAGLVRQKLGDSAYYHYPYKRLFHKIGMHTAIIEADASGTLVGSSYGWASTRDWARFGLLYLNDGVWNGERILPEGWVAFSTTPAPAAPRQEYGAQIWLNRGAKNDPSDCHFPGLPSDAFVFDGFEENSVVIIPSRNVVIARNGVTHHKNFDLAQLVNGVLGAVPDGRSGPHAVTK